MQGWACNYPKLQPTAAFATLLADARVLQIAADAPAVTAVAASGNTAAVTAVVAAAFGVAAATSAFPAGAGLALGQQRSFHFSTNLILLSFSTSASAHWPGT